jgi:hypothetical protein
MQSVVNLRVGRLSVVVAILFFALTTESPSFSEVNPEFVAMLFE